MTDCRSPATLPIRTISAPPNSCPRFVVSFFVVIPRATQNLASTCASRPLCHPIAAQICQAFEFVPATFRWARFSSRVELKLQPIFLVVTVLGSYTNSNQIKTLLAWVGAFFSRNKDATCSPASRQRCDRRRGEPADLSARASPRAESPDPDSPPDPSRVERF